MRWTEDFQLFLFDFDGLLVNTEELHYLAYKQMMHQRGLELTWDFSRYCLSAHYTAEKLRNELYTEFPLLNDLGMPWEALYHEKQQAIHALLIKHPPNLLEGVEELLQYLQAHHMAHCVVTHSSDSLVNTVRQAHPTLDQIPFWITRHDYTHPKPDPECYELAISRYGKPGNRVIGFEDSPRGLSALMGSSAVPVLVTQIPYPEIPDLVARGAHHYRSFSEIGQGKINSDFQVISE